MATEGDPCAECLVVCCGMMCAEACCCYIQTECCGAGDDACCCAVTVLSALALAALVAAYAVVFPVHVSVDEALLGRLALADSINSTAGTTALAYDVALAVAVRNRNFAIGVWCAGPLDAELRFCGQTFARARLAGAAPPGRIPALAKAVYRVAASDDKGAPVALGGDGVAEFVREGVAGEFELELVVVGEVKYEGHPHRRSVRATCPLQLPLSTATAQAAFTRVCWI